MKAGLACFIATVYDLCSCILLLPNTFVIKIGKNLVPRPPKDRPVKIKCLHSINTWMWAITQSVGYSE